MDHSYTRRSCGTGWGTPRMITGWGTSKLLTGALFLFRGFPELLDVMRGFSFFGVFRKSAVIIWLYYVQRPLPFCYTAKLHDCLLHCVPIVKQGLGHKLTLGSFASTYHGCTLSAISHIVLVVCLLNSA